MLRLGVDIGGTKTEVIVLDNAGIERYRHREPTPHGIYEDALVWLEALILEAERSVGAACTVGIGTPGSLSQHGRLRNAYATPYNERPLLHDLKARLGRAVSMGNDANCFALSEALDGAARGAQVVFGAILGTGVGGGIVVRNRVLEGANLMAGEWGHNPLPVQLQTPAPPCKCGRLGCIEAYLSGPGLAFDHATVSGQNLVPEEIVVRAAQGDGDCAATLARHEERLARALADVINLLDPDVIVLGGGLSKLDRLFENVPRLWVRHVYLNPEATRLVRPMHGDSSGVRGAAWLGDKRLNGIGTCTAT